MSSYPRTRLRRNRRTPWLRALVAEHRLHVTDLIWPVFVIEGENCREPIASMPEIERLSIDLMLKSVGAAQQLGLQTIALFPAIASDLKTEDGAEATNPDNLICRAIAALKNAHPDMGLISDVALDPYTTHGHDGIVRDSDVLNDETIEVLCQQALVQAKAGVDIIAPSDMMDGRVGAIRDTLDRAGYQQIAIMAYSAKYASSFYGPFRDAVKSSTLQGGTKQTYQMDPANAQEALREIALDIEEGADMVMVKPGLPYLDIITRAKQQFQCPIFAYQVSGEYAMLKAAAQNGWLDYNTTLMESLLCFKRAGATGILTYAALEAARLMKVE